MAATNSHAELRLSERTSTIACLPKGGPYGREIRAIAGYWSLISGTVVALAAFRVAVTRRPIPVLLGQGPHPRGHPWARR